MAVDIYGITKLYPDATGTAAQVWYMNMSNPLDDSRAETGGGVTFTLDSDGGWIVDIPTDTTSPNVRYYLYSESQTKQWLNVEITIYTYLIRDTDPAAATNPDAISDYVTHLYTRGARHTSSANCIGTAYKGRIVREKGGTSQGILPGVSFTKEIAHDAYTSSRTNVAPAQYLQQCGPMDRWIGSKFIVYNMPHDASLVTANYPNGRTPVKLEYWVDEDGMARNGTFDTNRQNWRKLGETIDNGGWIECLIDGNPSNPVSGCPPLEIGNTTGQRQCDEIINVGGGVTNDPDSTIPDGNAVVFRSDNIIQKVKWFSGREIIPPP